jgi:hypothetical protein
MNEVCAFSAGCSDICNSVFSCLSGWVSQGLVDLGGEITRLCRTRALQSADMEHSQLITIITVVCMFVAVGLSWHLIAEPRNPNSFSISVYHIGIELR